MRKPGQYKAIIDRLKKTLDDKGDSLDPKRRRALRKRLKRAQRRRNVATKLQERAAGKAEAGSDD